MQIKQETSNVTVDNNQFASPSQDMQCGDKSSPYSLWADYFDNFPNLTEFDLRSQAPCGSTGTSIASSASSESWSPGSGSPFSDQEDSAFIDDHAVPTSVIDEIVQTLKMDGYNFDHLGDEIMDMPMGAVVKHEQEMTGSPCVLQNPVYTSLTPPKLQQYDRKYNNNNNTTTSNMNTLIYDQILDNKQWCTPQNALPPMSKLRSH